MSKQYIFLLILINILSVYSEPKCEEGKNNCVKCNPITNLCLKCDKNVFVPDENGGCENSKKCVVGINYCETCNEKETLCEECDIGYFPDENGGCSNIPNCEVSYRGECLKCIEDFILIGNNIKICKSLNSEDYKNCEKINELNGLCEKCSEDYYLNSGDKKCISIEHCYESSLGVCSECEQSYYLNKKENKCKEKKDNLKLYHCKVTLDDEKCELCEDDYHLDNYGKCVEAIYCRRGNDLFQCESCLSGYYLTYNNTCTNDKNCFDGDKATGICTDCKLDYYIDFKDGKCKSNLEDNEFKFCQKVSNGKCTQCRPNYYLGSDDKCSTSNHCVESDMGECIECEEEYRLGLDKRCTNTEKCTHTYSYKDECEECEDGYYYNVNDKKCIETDKYNEHCKNGNTYNCLNCKEGFYLLHKENICVSNKEKGQFYMCTESSFYGDLCIHCEKDYFLGLDYKCSNITGCVKSENGNKCNECNMYYCLDLPTRNCVNNKIVKSEEKKFYYKCNKTDEDGEECEVCINGYSLNKNGLCVNDKGCKEKDEEEESCKTCNNNFCLNKEFECVATDNKNCLECNDILDFNKCTKCKKGYELDDDNQCAESD